MSYSLIIDTSDSSALYGVTFQGETIFEFCTVSTFEHTRTCLEFISMLCRECCISLNDYTYFVIATGPGSFTGLRTSFATLKTISAALTIPLIGISTLHALALSASHYTNDREYIVSCKKAQSSYTFGAVYRRENTNSFVPVINDNCFEEHEFIQLVQNISVPAKRLLFAGDYHLFENQIDMNGILLSPIKIPNIQAYDILSRAFIKGKNREQLLCEGASLLPQYLQKTQAEKKLGNL